jgi:ATP-dependent DNA ligase
VPLIAEALRALRVRSVTIDSDGVVCRADGVSDFDRLRAAVSRLGSRDAFLYAFDLLEIDGEDLRQSRRAMLRSLLKRTGTAFAFPIISTAMARSHSSTHASLRLRGSQRKRRCRTVAAAELRAAPAAGSNSVHQSPALGAS